jgi:hypothetical protein
VDQEISPTTASAREHSQQQQSAPSRQQHGGGNFADDRERAPEAVAMAASPMNGSPTKKSSPEILG